MLVLARKTGERITIDGDIEVEVLAVHGNSVRLGITAPRSTPIRRKELKPKSPNPNSSKKTSDELPLSGSSL